VTGGCKGGLPGGSGNKKGRKTLVHLRTAWKTWGEGFLPPTNYWR